MNLKSLSALGAGLLLAACSQAPRTDSLTQYVDMRIGTGGHGHVFMGANVPYGAVQLGPTSIPQSWDWTSGYHISDTTVIGFSHTHLNGTGIGDLFDVTVMPVVGQVTYARGTEDDPQSGMWSYFSHANEKARPGYYATRLDRYGIDVELTATKRVGLHKYTFPASVDAAVVFDLENGGCWDAPTETFIERADDHTISGYRYSTGWAKDQRVYFTAEFSKPFKSLAIYEGGEGGGLREGDSFRAERLYGRVGFDTSAGETIYVKVAISPVSIENARLNMQAELPGWDFEATAAAADQAWDAELQKVRIETSDDAARRIFYTALYHTMVAPSEFCDVNGDYRGSDGKIYRAAPFVNYTTFSLWDTYRAAQPLMTILHPEKMPDIANTMLHIYRQQGKLPVWHLMGNETDCMVGNPGIPALADAVLKGYGGFDREQAYEALKQSAMLGERGMDLRMKYGYIPCDLFNEAVAYDMEYALADWAVAQVAKELGKTADYDYFLERSKSTPRRRLLRGQRMAVHLARAARRRGADRLFRRQGSLHRETRLALRRQLRARGSRLARHLGPDRSVRPRQRTQPPRRLPLHDDRSAVEDRRQGARDTDDALPRPARRAFGQRGRGADVGMVRPLVAGFLPGRTRRGPLFLRLAALRQG